MLDLSIIEILHIATVTFSYIALLQLINRLIDFTLEAKLITARLHPVLISNSEIIGRKLRKSLNIETGEIKDPVSLDDVVKLDKDDVLYLGYGYHIDYARLISTVIAAIYLMGALFMTYIVIDSQSPYAILAGMIAQIIVEIRLLSTGESYIPPADAKAKDPSRQSQIDQLIERRDVILKMQKKINAPVISVMIINACYIGINASIICQYI